MKNRPLDFLLLILIVGICVLMANVGMPLSVHAEKKTDPDIVLTPRAAFAVDLVKMEGDYLTFDKKITRSVWLRVKYYNQDGILLGDELRILPNTDEERCITKLYRRPSNAKRIVIDLDE